MTDCIHVQASHMALRVCSRSGGCLSVSLCACLSVCLSLSRSVCVSPARVAATETPLFVRRLGEHLVPRGGVGVVRDAGLASGRVGLLYVEQRLSGSRAVRCCGHAARVRCRADNDYSGDSSAYPA